MGTITKALNLLSFFSETVPELGLMEFTKLSTQDKATVHRHLTELEANGFLEQNLETRKYRLGAAVLRLSAIREQTFPARSIASYWVKKLAAELGELVHASLIQGTEMSPLCFCDGGIRGTRVHFSEAEILPMHATASGLAALAFGPADLLEKILSQNLEAYTDYTPIKSDELRGYVEATQKAGFAHINQAFEDEVCAVAVPFFETGNRVSGTVAMAVPSSRIDDMNLPQIAVRLWQTADAISNELGGSIPPQLKKHMSKAA